MICIWSSWCHCHPIISCSSKIQNGLPCWCRLTQVVLEKRLLNGCSSSSSGSRLNRIRICSPRSCMVHTVDRFGSEGWFSCDQVIIWMCFVRLLAKQHAAFKWSDAFSEFSVSQAGAEALVRWREKNKIRIACFLSIVSAKSFQKRLMYVEVMYSKQKVACFFRMQTIFWVLLTKTA